MNVFQRFGHRVANAVRAFKAAPTTLQSLGPFRRGMDAPKDWDVTRGIKEGYKANETVSRCVDLRAEAIGSVSWYVEQKQGDNEWERVEGHPLANLLAKPNKRMPRRIFFEYISQHLDLGGNAIISLIRTTDLQAGGKRPTELHLLNPAGVTVIPGDSAKNGLIAQYRYRLDGYEKLYSADDALHIMRPDPSTFLWGQSILQCLARTVDAQVAAQKWNLSSFANRMVPDGMLTFPNRSITREDYELIRHELDAEQAGSDNARRILVFGEGAQYEMLSWKPTEMDFIEGLKLNRENIASAFGVPLPMISIMEYATEANADTSRRQFWEDTVIPCLDLIRDQIELVLMPEFHQTDADQYRLCYDLSGIPALRPDFTAKTEQYAKLVENGVSPNAARKRLEMDLEDEEGGDVAYIKSTLMPMEMGSEMAQEQLRMGQAERDNMQQETAIAARQASRAADKALKAADKAVEYLAQQKPEIITNVKVEPQNITVAPAPPPEVKVNVEAPVVHNNMEQPEITVKLEGESRKASGTKTVTFSDGRTATITEHKQITTSDGRSATITEEAA